MWVYFFGELGKESKDLLGGKGAGLSEMKKIGIPVPNGFTITTEVCSYYNKNNEFPKGLKKEVNDAMKRLEKETGKTFGKDLFVSVRSGAAISMPGMMDTVLNLGLNDKNVKVLAKNANNERFALDSYRRFIQMFGNVVLGIEHEKFEKILKEVKKKNNRVNDYELSEDELKEIIEKYKKVVKKEKKIDFPQDPEKQLWLAIKAVFDSWNNERAKVYRQINNIKGLKGTAVNIVEMVFGNFGDDSGTGVAFTRNPNTGENEIYGEYLVNAQGEDVVAGIRTPMPISELKTRNKKVYDQLLNIKDKLEKNFKDMQDIEFTVERGKLFLLQTRNGKRSARAAIKIAVDLVKEKKITKEDAIRMVKPEQIENVLHPTVDPSSKNEVIAKGLAASPGAAIGKVVFSPEKAYELKKNGEKVILVREETSAEDVKGMHSAEGILTATGGMTSHAAVVARGMGKPCIVGCGEIEIKGDSFSVGEIKVNEGDVITLNGNTGEVLLGEAKLQQPKLFKEFETLMKWCDSVRRLKVKANAETETDAKKAVELGAEGIGLARTEHMFFNGERIKSVRKMILAKTLDERKSALKELLPMQKEDFYKLIKVMGKRPITIRLLDPPLHEFMPKDEKSIEETARDMGITAEKVKEKIQELKEQNPMLGWRGCRLAITYPEIYGMQVQAITEAVFKAQRDGLKPNIQIMIPLVGKAEELKIIKEYLEDIIERMERDYKQKFNHKIGTMIEVPRAALTADEIAKYAEFFSFGTNDLTQMTLGFSRDDAGKFIPYYLDKEIYSQDPFKSVDQDGVGKLMKMATEAGRETRRNLEVGICGEQGGDPETIEFCEKIGLDYVSCSPYRIPVARLAAAKARLKKE